MSSASKYKYILFIDQSPKCQQLLQTLKNDNIDTQAIYFRMVSKPQDIPQRVHSVVTQLPCMLIKGHNTPVMGMEIAEWLQSINEPLNPQDDSTIGDFEPLDGNGPPSSFEMLEPTPVSSRTLPSDNASNINKLISERKAMFTDQQSNAPPLPPELQPINTRKSVVKDSPESKFNELKSQYR